MFKSLVSGFLLIVASASNAQAQSDGRAAADHLAAALQKVSYINFYFVSVTEDYALRGAQFKAASTTRIYRACGSNCSSYMAEVIAHLKQAVPAKCLPGQENVLIEIGNKMAVLYSYSGRMIQFEGRCYMNKAGINEVIEKPRFIFQ
ncbi:MAG: hypothetical protein JSR26_00225 [Proteobacteria bacterium]|nr:hypothetical protein [Pseudomonadota bacterium]